MVAYVRMKDHFHAAHLPLEMEEKFEKIEEQMAELRQGQEEIRQSQQDLINRISKLEDQLKCKGKPAPSFISLP